MALPLEGITVLDCTQVMAGPFCTLLLADMGAEVIKVEKPDGGDDSHRMGPPFVNGESAAFLAINRNKKSIVIDLKQKEGRELFKKMVPQVDVVAENFRPGTMDKLGLGYETLKKLNPALLYVAVSGFGQTGPYASRGGFDLVAQGMSGLMSVTGLPDSPPVKIGVPITDLNAGMYAAYGLLSAYIHRLKTGQGQMIDMSLLEGGIAYTFWESSELWNAGHVPEALGSAHRLSAPYQALPTADGYINLGVANQPNWERFCKAAGLDDLMEDPRFAINSERVQRYQELASLLEKTTRAKSTAEWLALLERVGVPAGPINNLEQVYNDPHVLARGMVQELEHPVAGVTKHIGVPVKLSETPGQLRIPAPTLGQHTDEVLRNFGYSPQEIVKFRDTRIVK
jgi:crotonobetainyl-CoA:carnitine CoA-transferase CaiB-like acyl-CoA transferase